MKLKFLNAENVIEGIKLVSEDLEFRIAERGANVTVNVKEVENAKVSVTLNGKKAEIVYGGGKARFFRGLAMLVSWVNDGIKQKEVVQTPTFKTNGAMGDMSRNVVFNIETAKYFLRKMALMGMNMFMLYTEDVYEIDGYQHFGYMRGMYTKAELKELDAYADTLGIELIPCIQMLGHLETHLKRPQAAPYKDAASTLLVGADATYDLIEAMLKTVKECFRTNRIHIGMDETFDLGLGNYLKRNGYRERREIYFEQVQRVFDMVTARGLKPMMWSDMFFRMAGEHLPGFIDYDPRVELDEAVTSKVPKGMQQVFWDYYNEDESFYEVNIDKHQKFLDENTMFAGGIWTWSGHTPLFRRSYKYTIAALNACRNKGVKEVLATIWNNGGEACHIISLAGLAWYADFDYLGYHDLESTKECLRFSSGVDYDTIMRTEFVGEPHDGLVSITRAALYNDPLMGLADKNIERIEGVNFKEYYKKLTLELKSAKGEKGNLQEAYDMLVAMSDLFENKVDFGIRLKKAYDADDKKTLKAMVKECELCVEKVKALQNAHYIAWMKYHKPQGWEVMDIRYGGIRARFETAKDRLEQYLEGEISTIGELDEERMLLYEGILDEKEPLIDGRFLWAGYSTFITANTL